jgi:hypothetical protein
LHLVFGARMIAAIVITIGIRGNMMAVKKD